MCPALDDPSPDRHRARTAGLAEDNRLTLESIEPILQELRKAFLVETKRGKLGG